MATAAHRTIGITPEVEQALGIFRASLEHAYGRRLRGLLVFGSRARGDAAEDSDVDVAIVLSNPIDDNVQEILKIAGLAYDAIAETGIHVQGWPVSEREWSDPSTHENPSLVLAMKRDGRAWEGAVSGPSHK